MSTHSWRPDRLESGCCSSTPCCDCSVFMQRSPFCVWSRWGRDELCGKTDASFFIWILESSAGQIDGAVDVILAEPATN